MKRSGTQDQCKVAYEVYRQARIEVGKKKKEYRTRVNECLHAKIVSAGGKASPLFWRQISNKDRIDITSVDENNKVLTEQNEMIDFIADYFQKLNLDNIKQEKDWIGESLNFNGYRVYPSQEELDNERSVIKQVSYKEIHMAVRSLKNGKACGLDNIPGEFIKNLNKHNLNILRQLFSLIFLRQEIPIKWKEDKMILIYKGKGDRQSIDNFRGISVCNVMAKCFSKIVYNRMSNLVEKNKLLGEIQFAFRGGRRGTDSLFILTQIMEIKKLNKEKVYVLFIDLRKAFDRVWRKGLWKKLLLLKFGQKTVNLLINMYSGIRKKLEVNSSLSAYFNSEIGVRQGCVLSPLLFALFIAELGNILTTSNYGVTMGDATIPALFFADDIVLIANTRLELENQFKNIVDYCSKWNLEINYKKTKLMIINGDNDDCSFFREKLLSEWKDIEIVNSFTYLGVPLCNGANIYKNWEQQVITRLKRYKGILKIKAMDSFNRLEVADALWIYVALGSSLFGSEVGVLSEDVIKRLESFQNEFGSWIIGADRHTAKEAIIGELGWYTIRKLVYDRKLTFWDHILHSHPKSWIFQVLSQMILEKRQSKWLRNLLKIKVELDYLGGGKAKGREKINNWFINNWTKGIACKSTLNLYPDKWSFRGRKYMNNSDDAKWYFRVIAGTIVKKYGEHKFRGCVLCQRDAVRIDEFHILCECMALNIYREEVYKEEADLHPEFGDAIRVFMGDLDRAIFKDLISQCWGLELMLGRIWKKIILCYGSKVGATGTQGLVLFGVDHHVS